MNFILEPDKISNGVITKLIEKTFSAECEGKRHNVLLEELIAIHEALKNYDNGNTFGEIAKEIVYPPKDYDSATENEDLRKAFINNNKEAYNVWRENIKTSQVTLFEQPGFVLYDGIYAKAGGLF